MYRQINRELLDFIESSPTSHFVIHNLKNRLFAEGYEELFENEQWTLENGGRYFVTRDNSSLIAFRVPEAESVSFHAILSHCDSPSLKLKPNFKEETLGIKKLSVEKYGGLISDSFFDIPLTLAGSVILSEDYGISERLVRIDNFGIIPRIPPHFATKQETNPSVDMYLMYGLKNSSDALCRIAKSLSVTPEKILSHDLYLVPYGKGTIWGENDEFISCSRLDNLQSVFASLAGFLNSDESVPLFP